MLILIRENSYPCKQEERQAIAPAGRLAARVSIHLTASAYSSDFAQSACKLILSTCLRSVAFLLAIFAVSFGTVTSAHAEASPYLCEAAFSGSLPVLKELAQLKVAATQAQAAGKPDLAVTLYRAFRKSSDQAKADGFDLRGLKAMLDEVEAKENNKRLDEEAREEKARALEEDRIFAGRRTIFHSIAPGKFMMGEVGSQIETEVSKPYEMAATQTTQIVWKKVVEQAKLKFPGKYDALNPDPSNFFKGELNPVEKTSWNDVQLWLDALNELAAQGDPIVKEVMPGHKSGQIYRLPTEAEWEFVARLRGEAKGTYHFGENETQLGEYAWYGANAKNETHPVAQKKPLVIDGRDFYDFYGNVWEWTQDSVDRTSMSKGGVDVGEEPYRVVRGGCWFNTEQNLRSGFRLYYVPWLRESHVGFRLVRASP